MATRFEPSKSGTYRVGYLKPDGFYESEEVAYDKKTNSWSGSMPADFYVQAVTSWMTTDASPIR